MDDQETNDLDELAKEYPGVEVAFDLAVDSYDSLVRRLDSIDGRIQTMLTFAATTTALVSTVANARGITFRSTWLFLALAAFAGQLVIGTYATARPKGTIRMVDPGKLYQKWLGWSKWEFKKNFIWYAGKDFEANRTLIEKKYRLSVAVSLLFFLEVVFLVFWVAAHL